MCACRSATRIACGTGSARASACARAYADVRAVLKRGGSGRPHWWKVLATREALRDYDYVFYLDSDAFVADYHRPLEQLLEQFGLLRGDKIMLVARDLQARSGPVRRRRARGHRARRPPTAPRYGRRIRDCLL